MACSYQTFFWRRKERGSFFHPMGRKHYENRYSRSLIELTECLQLSKHCDIVRGTQDKERAEFWHRLQHPPAGWPLSHLSAPSLHFPSWKMRAIDHTDFQIPTHFQVWDSVIHCSLKGIETSARRQVNHTHSPVFTQCCNLYCREKASNTSDLPKAPECKFNLHSDALYLRLTS